MTLGVYYAESIAAGANTVTVSDTISGRHAAFRDLQYSGVAAASSLDGTPAMAEEHERVLASPTTTTTSSGDLILGVLSTSNSATFTAGERFHARRAGARRAQHQAQRRGSEANRARPDRGDGYAVIGASLGGGRRGVSSGLLRTATERPQADHHRPAEASTVNGSTVNVSYTWTGDLTEVNHVHFQLDGNPVVMDLSFEGVFQFTGVHVGSHTLNGWLVRADRSTIVGSDSAPRTSPWRSTLPTRGTDRDDDGSVGRLDGFRSG